MQYLIPLLAMDLNVKKFLILHQPRDYFKTPLKLGEERVKMARIRQEHVELSNGGRSTRARAFDAVYKRFWTGALWRRVQEA